MRDPGTTETGMRTHALLGALVSVAFLLTAADTASGGGGAGRGILTNSAGSNDCHGFSCRQWHHPPGRSAGKEIITNNAGSQGAAGSHWSHPGWGTGTQPQPKTGGSPASRHDRR
jgi:hypothetical protein